MQRVLRLFSQDWGVHPTWTPQPCTTKSGWMSKTGQTSPMTLTSEPASLKPFAITEMERVVDEAVEAYRRATAAMRGSRSKIKKLYQTNNHQKVRYIGPSADHILEEYLTQHGLDTCSAMWSDLSRIVIDKAEREIFNKEDLVLRCTVNKLPFVI